MPPQPDCNFIFLPLEVELSLWVFFLLLFLAGCIDCFSCSLTRCLGKVKDLRIQSIILGRHDNRLRSYCGGSSVKHLVTSHPVSRQW